MGRGQAQAPCKFKESPFMYAIYKNPIPCPPSHVYFSLAAL